jgi:DNA-binding transcriptional LysR family regulator
MEALMQSVLAGFGIGYMPDFLVSDALAAGQVASVLDAYTTTVSQFSIVWPSSRHPSPRLRAFVDFMCERLFKAARAQEARALDLSTLNAAAAS